MHHLNNTKMRLSFQPFFVCAGKVAIAFVPTWVVDGCQQAILVCQAVVNIAENFYHFPLAHFYNMSYNSFCYTSRDGSLRVA